jgi:type II secretory pathway component PulC
MKLQLWVINSSLALIFCVTLGLDYFLEVNPPVVRIKSISTLSDEKAGELAPVIAGNWEKIYQNDVFGTYVKRVDEFEAVKPQLVTPPPVSMPAQFTPPPEPQMPSFIPPLNIVLKGIIVAGDEQKSAAIIADETNKEQMYYLGGKVKDAQIIRIARNRLVLLRANGQQESFYLVKDDPFLSSTDKWENIVKKINDQDYKVDPNAFALEVDSLGNFMERVGILGTAYSKGNPIGVKIGDVKNCDVANALGIMQNDIVLVINDETMATDKSRVRLFDKISKMKIGDSILVKLLRAGNEVLINYELAKFPRVSKSLVAVDGGSAVVQQASPEKLPMNPMQERERNLREFAKRHGGNERDQRTASDLRSKFLENLREKLKHARSRAR